MTPNYKGNKTDLVDCSFLTKECVNPEYLKKVSDIFKLIVANATEKKYKELIINGNVAYQLL